MKAQAQFTIHSLNDVIASTTAPSSPYKGQLWVNTSYSPPRTFVYNGSAWKEQNGTDTLRSNISTLTTKSNTMQSSLDGLTSTVSLVTTRVETVENDMGVVEENILDIQTDVSELEQTASSIAIMYFLFSSFYYGYLYIGPSLFLVCNFYSYLYLPQCLEFSN